VDAANRPTAHASQLRSAVPLGVCVTNFPAEHVVCVRHAAWPAESWNASAAQTVHDVASSASENWPIGQFVQTRSVLVVGAAVWRAPLRQPCTLRHTVCPDEAWNSPPRQAVHVVLALAFWIRPAAHAWQYAAAFWLTAPEPKRPGSHASQKKAFGVALCLPAAHARQLLAFSSAEYWPAAQF